jgi:dTDP-4-dehydrorhamnose 3,5-epimerase-like enzyme
MNPTSINFKPLGDDRGHLVAVESGNSIPFDIQRVYYIFGTLEGVERGFHAHKVLNQVAVAISGSCDMVLDDGIDQATVHLGSPTEGVFVGPGMWHYMSNFSKDCVLLVFADAHYDESDYIRDYDEFTSWISKQTK